MTVLEIPADYRKGKSVHDVLREWREISDDEPKDSHLGVMLDIWEMRQILAYIKTLESPETSDGEAK